MSEMYIYVPKLPLFTFYYNARGFVLINILLIYLFSNFCHNKPNIIYFIISYYILHPIMYNACLFSYILKYSMFMFHFPPFSPFVCPTRSDKNMINQEVGVAYGKVYPPIKLRNKIKIKNSLLQLIFYIGQFFTDC